MLQVSPRQSPDNPPRPSLVPGRARTLEQVHGLIPFVTDGVGGMMALFAYLEAEHTIRHVDD